MNTKFVLLLILSVISIELLMYIQRIDIITFYVIMLVTIWNTGKNIFHYGKQQWLKNGG